MTTTNLQLLVELASIGVHHGQWFLAVDAYAADAVLTDGTGKILPAYGSVDAAGKPIVPALPQSLLTVRVTGNATDSDADGLERVRLAVENAHKAQVAEAQVAQVLTGRLGKFVGVVVPVTVADS